MSSKKTVVKITPAAPVKGEQKVKRKHDYLRDSINVILKRQMLHLNVKKVFDILGNDLHINLKNVTPRMKYVLSECLCYYMKNWPGWRKYDVVCINERAKMDYIEKFKEYLAFKVRYIIENEKVFNPDVENENQAVMKSQEVQTDPINKKNKPEAPYNLVISGQPNVLNNIVFIEMDSNIVIKQHAEKPWKPLNVAEFLNYSFVYVTIKLPDLELSRSNLHEFQRYITECGDTASCPDVDFITYVRKKNTLAKPRVYSMDFIHAYCKQFIDTIKKVPGINGVKITELEEVFRQFILDIQESHVFTYTNSVGSSVNTMATDTTVCFNIGGRTYIRNKKMVVNADNQKETNAINFCEVLIPRMAYTLAKFLAEEDPTTEDTSFMSLNDINLQVSKNSQELYKFVEAVNSSVTYHCLLCPKTYSGDRAYIDILDHYRFLHKGEQSVLCFTCRQQFAIAKLAGDRWAHDCKDSTDTSKVTVENPITSNAQTIVTNSRPAIGINDILTSSKSSISVDDLVTNQTVGADTPAIVGNLLDVNMSETINTTLTSAATPTVAATSLPVVRVSTTNAVMSPFGYNTILAIAPGSVVSNTVSSYLAPGSSNANSSASLTLANTASLNLSTPLITSSNSLISTPPSLIAQSNPLIVQSSPLIAPSSQLIAQPSSIITQPSPLIAQSSPLIAPTSSLITTPSLIATSTSSTTQNAFTSDVSLNVDDCIREIKIEVNGQENITNVTDISGIQPPLTNTSLTMPILPVTSTAATSFILAPIMPAPIDDMVGVQPASINTANVVNSNMDSGSIINTTTPFVAASIVPALTTSIVLSNTLP